MYSLQSFISASAMGTEGDVVDLTLELLDTLRDQLLHFYLSWRNNNLPQTIPLVVDIINSYHTIIDSLLMDIYGHEDFEYVIRDDFFMYRLSPSNLVVRPIDVNFVNLERRAIRRPRRRARGKENKPLSRRRRPPPQQ